MMKLPRNIFFAAGIGLGLALSHPAIAAMAITGTAVVLTIGWLMMGAPHDIPEEGSES